MSAQYKKIYEDELGYTKRRKRSASMLEWTPKAVLSSPLFLLVLWLAAVYIGGTGRKIPSNDYQAVRIPVRPSHNEAVRVPVRPHHHNRNALENTIVMLQPNPNLVAAQQAKRGTKMVVQPPDLTMGGSMMATNQNANVLSMPEMMATHTDKKNKIPILHNANTNAKMRIGTSSNHLPILQQTEQLSPPPEGQIPVYSPLGDVHGNYYPQPIEALPLVDTTIVRPRPHPTPRLTKVLYYDASAVGTDGSLPETVYEQDGSPIDVTALRATNADIYIEPPPSREMSVLSADPPAQDQYIIIATVAVMALLVGAVTARRLRSKNILSSCIENESLEDELAYDTAYTTSAAAGKYETFGPWKGDLEKFDV